MGLLSEEEYRLLPEVQQIEYLRQLRGIRGKESLLYLCREILRNPDVDDVVHGKLERVLGGRSGKKLVMLPRGSFKSTIGTIGNCIYSILNNPDIRILIDSEVLENSQKFLNQIKTHLRSKDFKYLYGTLIDRNRRETAREFTVTTRKNQTLKEPTVYAAGVGTVNVGMHYDKIIADDLHSEKNVSTQEQIEKVIAHYRLLMALLEPGGELVIIGTRWHFADLYSFILEEEASDGWEVYIEQAMRKDGSLFFPNRLTKEYLKSQQKALGNYLYSCNYQNEPMSEEMQTFKKKDFRYWGDVDDLFPTQDGKRVLLNLYVIIDRAFSSKATADYTGCVLVGVSCSGNLYVLEAVRKKCGLQELFNLIAEWGKKYSWSNIKKVGIETINFEELEVFFREQMGKSGNYFILERLMPQSKMSKHDRIEKSLQARYANHAVFHKKRMIDLEDELLRFPVGTHDDLVDALAYITTLMTVPGDPRNETDEIEYAPSGMFGRSGY